VGSERRAAGNFNDAALIAEGVNHDEVQSERYVAHAVRSCNGTHLSDTELAA